MIDEYLQPGASYARLKEEYDKHKGLVLGVDFDGTLFDYHQNGASHQMVHRLVKDLKAIGCIIIIWTANKSHTDVAAYLSEQGIPFDGINTDGINLGWASRKPFFNCLLDDRSGLEQTYKELTALVDYVKLSKAYGVGNNS